MSSFYQHQVQQRPKLPAEHFLKLVCEAKDIDVLLITVMRDEAPVAAFSYLVPEKKLIEVQIHATKESRKDRLGPHGSRDSVESSYVQDLANNQPDFIFDNDAIGSEAAKRFCEDHPYPFMHKDI